jgi:hypothetical protein
MTKQQMDKLRGLLERAFSDIKGFRDGDTSEFLLISAEESLEYALETLEEVQNES